VDERALLLKAIRQKPDEDAARLALADWLDEHGETRVTCPTCKGHKKTCTACDGDGLSSGPPECRTCRRCDGEGVLPVSCSTCDSTGTIIDTANRDRAALLRVQCELSRSHPRTRHRRARIRDGGGTIQRGGAAVTHVQTSAFFQSLEYCDGYPS